MTKRNRRVAYRGRITACHQCEHIMWDDQARGVVKCIHPSRKYRRQKMIVAGIVVDRTRIHRTCPLRTAIEVGDE